MVPSKDFFNDDESLEQRPGKGRNFGNKSKDKKRFESQEDFGITKRSSKGRSEEFEEDDEFLTDLEGGAERHAKEGKEQVQYDDRRHQLDFATQVIRHVDQMLDLRGRKQAYHREPNEKRREREYH